MFATRVLLLLGLMALMAAIDRYRHGRQATRFQEYGFILLAGLIGAMVGGFNDAFTCGISPEYFTLGKGLETQESLRWGAAVLGVKTGFSAGIIAGAACLFACGRGADAPASKLLLKRLWWPVAGAFATGFVLALVGGRFDPLDFAAQLKNLATTSQIKAFRQVWWIHCGLYAGMALGVTGMILATRRELHGHEQPNLHR